MLNCRLRILTGDNGDLERIWDDSEVGSIRKSNQLASRMTGRCLILGAGVCHQGKTGEGKSGFGRGEIPAGTSCRRSPSTWLDV